MSRRSALARTAVAAAVIAVAAIIVVIVRSSPSASGTKVTARSPRPSVADRHVRREESASVITGTVRSSAGGAPVARAAISAFVATHSGVSSGRVRATGPALTDDAGVYRLVGLDRGEYAVVATAAGMKTSFQPGVQVPDDRSTVTVDFTLTPGGRRLAGRVSDSGGGSIASAIVAVLPVLGLAGMDAIPALTIKTDPSGHYDVRLPTGAYQITVSAEGYGRRQQLVGLLSDLDVDFFLEPAARVAGRVVARGSGQPISGATVVLESRLRAGQTYQTTSDQAGRFAITEVAAGRYWLFGRAAGMAGHRSAALDVVSGRELADLELSLDGGFRVSGLVRQPPGTGVAGAAITLVPTDGTVATPVAATSDATGAFALDGVGPGRYQLTATSGHRSVSSRAVVLSTDLTGVELTLGAASGVQGQVLDRTGQPVADASVRAWTTADRGGRRRTGMGQTRTATDGRFAVSDLTVGFLWVDADSDQGNGHVGPLAASAGETQDVTIRLGEGARIAGTVHWTPEGGRAANVIVRCSGGEVTRIARTGFDGQYVCESVQPGRNQVTVGRTAIDEVWDTSSLGMRELTVDVGEFRKGVDLKLARADDRISGIVLAPDGTPVGAALVAAAKEEGGMSVHFVDGGILSAKALSADDGSFTLEALPRGAYTVWAHHDRWPEARQRSVASGSQSLRLQFRAAGSLSGRVIESGRPVRSFTMAATGAATATDSYEVGLEQRLGRPLVQQAFDDQAGVFTLRDLRAGAYELTATTPDGRTGRLAGIVLAEGEEKDGLEILLEASITLRGAVIDETGRPLPETHVVAHFPGRDASADTGADGTYRIEGAPPGVTVQLETRVADTEHIDDHCVIDIPRVPAAADVDAGTFRLIRGRPGSRDPIARLGWSLEGRAGATRVAAVRPGGPAASHYVVPGSVLAAVDGRDVSHFGPGATSYLMFGPRGTTLTLAIRRPDGKVIDWAMTRAPREGD